MKTLPYIVFSFLMLCALGTGINSYRRTKSMITQDVNRALEQVLAKMPDDVVTTDTIRCYRNCLTIAEMRDTAGIAMRTVRKDGRLETTLVAEDRNDVAVVKFVAHEKETPRADGARTVIRRHRVQWRQVYDAFWRADSSYAYATFAAQDVHNDRIAYAVETRNLRPSMA